MAVVIRWTTPGKKTLDIVQNIKKAVILPRTNALQKNLASRLPEVRLISTFHMKQPEYLENVQRIFLRPKNVF